MRKIWICSKSLRVKVSIHNINFSGHGYVLAHSIVFDILLVNIDYLLCLIYYSSARLPHKRISVLVDIKPHISLSFVTFYDDYRPFENLLWLRGRHVYCYSMCLITFASLANKICDKTTMTPLIHSARFQD